MIEDEDENWENYLVTEEENDFLIALEDATNIYIRLICGNLRLKHKLNIGAFLIDGAELSNLESEDVITYCRTDDDVSFIVVGADMSLFNEFSKTDQQWMIAHEAAHAVVFKYWGPQKEHHGHLWQRCMQCIGFTLQHPSRRD